MKTASVLSVCVLLLGASSTIRADRDDRTVIVTSSNAAANQLLVFDTEGALIQTVSTQGQGGVGGNAGGIATLGSTVAVVNFGSQSVTIFDRAPQGFRVGQLVPTLSSPVSVAFGHDHLYVLGTTTVESHRLHESAVDPGADGVVALLRGDGSSAQVGVVGDQLVISEKSGVIEVVDLREGAVVGSPAGVDIPVGSDTPFGLVTRGSNGYVTIAHSDEISLIKNGRLTAMMAVHQDRPREWAPAEVTLVQQVAERCWAHVERVGAEARLRDSEERLRLAVENAEVGFWDVDEVNGKLIWPPQTKAMFGISADVPVTMDDFYRGLHPDDFDKTAAAYSAAADPNIRALYDVEYRTIGKEDQVERWVAAKGRGIFDMSGRCLRVAGTALDITVRKRAESALHELNATLEARIEQAIAEREQVQDALRQSQKMEAMGQLTGGVAHDFNNLLTPIVGSLDLLQRKGAGGEREQRLIAGAIQSAERARVLVQRLLAFARRQPLQPVPVDVADLVNGMGDLIESTTGPQIKVSLQAGDKLPLAKADPNQLEMALLNLTVNARDAMPQGGELRIAANADSVGKNHPSSLSPGTYVRLSVADTGSGMSEETLSRAIEPFFSTKGVGKGTGLGLSMAHGLAAQLGGSLTIESRPGIGTTVALWLPISAVEEDAMFITNKEGPGTLKRGVALLVDDEFLVRMCTADMLADLGYEVVEADTAEEALRIFNDRSSIDIVITDHLMPGMTGTDLIRHVRSIRPNVPVLMVSGYAQMEGVTADIPRLTKPFRSDELAAALEGISELN